MRINKAIASFTEFSRRKADELIENGDVFLNGKIVKELGIQIDPEKDQLKVRGKIITAKKEEKIYIALNKPKGYITTRDDELGRETVMSLVPQNKNLKPIGRLDFDTEGLLLFSNDGEFINRLTHPRFECEKKYFAQITGALSEVEKDQLEKGIKIENKKTAPAKIIIIEKTPRQTVLTITIHEGRKRQIRKMFSYLEHPVKYLQRISIGKIYLGNLKKGQYRFLTQKEINAYKSA